MSDAPLTFGRRALQTATAAELLELEAREDRGRRFTEQDALITSFLTRSLAGQTIAAIVRDMADTNHVHLPGLTDSEQVLIDATFGLDRQRERGALFHPAKVSLKVGLASLPQAFSTYGRFGFGMAWEERGQVELRDSAAVILFWAVLEPLFEQLYLPITLRSHLAGNKSREEQQALWTTIDACYSALGWSVSDALKVMRWGGGWHKLRVQEQWEAKRRLVVALAPCVSPQSGSLARTHVIRPLIAAYYKRAKSGLATRKQVLTKPLERILSGWFSGDWLQFLAYLGESPHPAEQIVTALPETRVFTGNTDRIADVADQEGLPADEVAKMLAAFWQQPGASPIDERVAVLRRYWHEFTAIHDLQDPSMTPLWGLVSEETYLQLGPPAEQSTVPYTPELYRQRLSADLISDIERLWGTTILPRYPEAIVTELFPHTVMAEVFGPALTFWHGASLTAWFLCEGPSSRTDMAGLAHYHRRALADLEQAGTPIDPRLFEDLIQAEKRQGRAQTVERDKEVSNVGFLTITTSFSYTRRNGFERLRDVIAQHRTTWATQYLEQYLRYRWESEVREAATQHALHLGNRSTPPTLKQFAKHAAVPTQHWFGGDIGKLYATIGEKAPIQPTYTRVVPDDIISFVHSLSNLLQAQRVRPSDIGHHTIAYFQLCEALGTPPTLSQFGRSKMAWVAQQANLTPEQFWDVFAAAIAKVKI